MNAPVPSKLAYPVTGTGYTRSEEVSEPMPGQEMPLGYVSDFVNLGSRTTNNKFDE